MQTNSKITNRLAVVVALVAAGTCLVASSASAAVRTTDSGLSVKSGAVQVARTSGQTTTTTGGTRPVPTGTVLAAKIQGGATGDGDMSEADCEKLGDIAENFASTGLEQVKNGDLTAGQANGAAAQAVVDLGMNHGCFFTNLPWDSVT